MMTPFLIAGFRTVKLLTLAAYGIFFYSVHFTDEDTYFFFNLLVFGGIILAIAQTLTSFGIMDLSLYYGDTDGRYIGPRILGHTKANIGRIFFMGIIVCMVLMRESKLRSLISICILTTGLVFTGSRAGIGALLVGFISICFLGRLRGVFMGGIFFIIILLFGLWALTYNDLMAERLLGTFGSHSLETGSQRFPIWEKTLSVWLTSPLLILFGVGAFNFSYANFHIPLNFEHAHNDLLTLGTELGFLSIVLFLAWIFLLLSALISKTLKSKDKERWHWVCMFAITVGLLFASQFEATFYPTISTLPFSRILYPFLFIILQRSYNTKSFLLKEEIS
jgi:O-antigen ligase